MALGLTLVHELTCFSTGAGAGEGTAARVSVGDQQDADFGSALPGGYLP